VPTPTAPARPTWWQCVAVEQGKPVWFAVVESARQADGARLTLGPSAAETAVGADAVCRATVDDTARVCELDVTQRGAPNAPPLWFGEHRESTAQPPAVSLMAFTEHGVAAGRLLESVDLPQYVRSEDQVGAVRWYPATGEVDQIYVQPQYRRRSIASALIAAAATLALARDWPRLWSDGQRTELGEQFRNGSPWRHRTADLSHLAPPMTPGG
jgi:GNAT superfamily N-acetyltransferase